MKSGTATDSAIKVLTGPVSYLATLGSALVTTSILTDKDEGLRAKVIRCACLECGQELSEGTIGQLCGGVELNACSHCSGTEFEFRVRPESPRHWVRIKDRLAQVAPDLREPEIVAKTVREPIPTARWLIIGGTLFVALILFFVLRYWYLGSPIPLIHQPKKYELKQTAPEEVPKIHKASSRDELEDEK